jgi:hypothetical protein
MKSYRKILIVLFFVLPTTLIYSKTVVFSGNFLKITINQISSDNITCLSIVLFLDSTICKCELNKLLYDFINNPQNFYECVSKCPIIGDDFSGLYDKNICRRYKFDNFFYYIMNETRDVPYTSLSFSNNNGNKESTYYYTVKSFTTTAKFVIHKTRNFKSLSFYDGKIYIHSGLIMKDHFVYYPIKKNRKEKIKMEYLP